jgi:hypothetical protein
MEDKCRWCNCPTHTKVGTSWCGIIVKCDNCQHEWEKVEDNETTRRIFQDMKDLSKEMEKERGSRRKKASSR